MDRELIIPRVYTMSLNPSQQQRLHLHHGSALRALCKIHYLQSSSEAAMV
jgi:hypothetical protein